VVRRRVPERSEDDRIRPQSAVAGVGDVDAVNHVLVVETAAARNGWVGVSRSTRAADTGREVQGGPKVASDGNAHEKIGGHDRTGFGCVYVYDVGGTNHLNGFGSTADL